MKIQDLAIAPPQEVATGATARPDGASKSAGFGSVLKQSLDEVNRLQQKADAAITALASGEKASLHDTMIAMEQASVSFRLMMQVRNKIVEAYQEVMRIQV
ncbi:MAG TPA: flagellar hook-basal body complex protein FliE [Candidatus Binatia bacterium]|nr:flagellar hook-basal body complex protein FliE [Candidatus Binatia bacterium]